MSRAEAIRLMTDQVRSLRARPVSEIAGRYEDDSVTVEIEGHDGVPYQVQVQAWSDFDGALLVFVSVDGGDIPATKPLPVAFRSTVARDEWEQFDEAHDLPSPTEEPRRPLLRRLFGR